MKINRFEEIDKALSNWDEKVARRDKQLKDIEDSLKQVLVEQAEFKKEVCCRLEKLEQRQK